MCKLLSSLYLFWGDFFYNIRQDVFNISAGATPTIQFEQEGEQRI